MSTDEKLIYYVGMSVDDGSGSEEVSPELKQFLSHLQVCLYNLQGESDLLLTTRS